MALPANQDLHRLFLEELAIMKDAESQLAKALFLLEKAAKSADLKKLIEIHLKETEGHEKSIDEIARTLDVELPKKSCKTMKRLIKSAIALLAGEIGSDVRDAALIAAAQKVEHYEIATYGTLCSWAKRMGHEHALAVLLSILNQEKLADKLLTGVAEGTKPLGKLIEEVSLKKVAAAAH